MRTTLTAVIALIVGAVLGAAGTDHLRAQAKPPVYLITEVDVTDVTGYAKEFVPKIQALIKASGGRDVARGGAGAAQLTVFEGSSPKRVGIQIYDSLEKIQAFRNSPEFKELRRIGDKYATFRAYAIDGVSQ